ncbi:guanylate kinase [Crassaminicella thermophila]|uniref:Guanylate kinase n=1 Tax=Crassaminicella thermophila TaxID=2599308 RepID=A0A5C0SDH2_CRATE|nr:guanylate kinase [Crassaminicella thermophila]QEK11992.1 guanylate kinase [Crassaminicella thermophila]
MMKKGLLIVISGPSGTGKGTVCKQLLNIEKDIKISISATTREPRVGEIDGVNYYFIDEDIFEKQIENDEFLEYAKVYDNYYGTPKKYVIEEIKKGNNVLLEIDIQGALQVKEKYPEGIFIFILPPSMEELKKRIIGRGTESEADINKRFESAFEEINYVKEYNYYVINDEVEKAVEKIRGIIKAESCKVTDNIEEIISRYKEELSC